MMIKPHSITLSVILILSGLLSFPTLLFSADFTVLALFPGKAMIQVGNKRILLKEGIKKKEFTLISTDTFEQTLVLDINGVKDTYSIGKQIGGGYAEPKSVEVRVSAHQSGGFLSSGMINGRSVDFLLDTGATAVSMNSIQAKRLGIKYINDQKKRLVLTAAGQREAYSIVLDNISIGGITLNNVNGIVLEGSSPEITLLGMSFLSRLDIKYSENLMVLTKKF